GDDPPRNGCVAQDRNATKSGFGDGEGTRPLMERPAAPVQVASTTWAVLTTSVRVGERQQNQQATTMAAVDTSRISHRRKRESQQHKRDHPPNRSYHQARADIGNRSRRNR